MNFIDLKLTVSDFINSAGKDAIIPRFIAFGQKSLERGIINPKTGHFISLRPQSMRHIPKPLSTPINAAFTSGTGTLGAGTYYYRIVAIDIFGGKTLASTETSLALGAAGGVNVNWTKVAGAMGYEIYGRATGAELLIATVGDVATYLDDGSVTPSGALPAKNTTCMLVNGANTIPVPSDYIELRYLGLIDGNIRHPVMERYGSQKTHEIGFTLAATSKRRPHVYDREGDSFILESYADKDYTINMEYFKHLSTLSDTNKTNWWSLNAEQALIYATLVEATPYLGDEPRGGVWFDKFIEEMEKLEKEINREKLSGKRVREAYTPPYFGS